VVVRRSAFTLDASVRLEPGDRLAVIGPNGAGKSTLLAALAGHLRLVGGRVVLAGRVLDDGRRPGVPPHRRGVVMLGQDPLVFPHLSVRRNVEYGPRAHGMTRTEATRRAIELLERLELGTLADEPGAALSGGQRQRVALARALAVEPSLLLLDEPFASLDVAAAARLRGATLDLLAERGTTCLVVSHDILDVAALAGQTVVLEAGQVTDRGSTPRVLSEPRSAFAATVGGIGVLDGQVVDGRYLAPGGWSVPVDAAPGPARVFVPPDAVALAPGGSAEVGSVTAAPAGVAVTFVDGARLFLTARWAVKPWLAPGALVDVRIDPAKLRLGRIS